MIDDNCSYSLHLFLYSVLPVQQQEGPDLHREEVIPCLYSFMRVGMCI